MQAPCAIFQVGGRHIIIILTVMRIQENLGKSLFKNILTYQCYKLLSLINLPPSKFFCWLAHHGTKRYFRKRPTLKIFLLHWKLSTIYLFCSLLNTWDIWEKDVFKTVLTSIVLSARINSVTSLIENPHGNLAFSQN